MADVELKDCPFCGGKPKLEQTGRKELTLKCTSCIVKYQFKVRNNSLEWLELEMIKDWNKRV